MNLSRHISELLKYHECVIIPEFGGFISNYQPAKFNAARNTFSPPSKEVIFNTKIKKNDGLLVNHLVEVEHLGYHQAETTVMNFVDGLYRQLNHGDTVELEELGTFHFDRSGTLIFEAAGPFQLLQAYGLKEVQYPTLHESSSIGTFQPRPAVRAINTRKDAVRIAASIALLLALSLFPVRTEKVKMHSSTLNPIGVMIEESAMPVNKTIVEAPAVEIKKEIVPVKETPAPYILVGGCFQFKSNAQQFENTLQAKGLHPEIVKLENGFYRVIVNSFNSKEKALDAMTAYRKNHSGSGVWVSTR